MKEKIINDTVEDNEDKNIITAQNIIFDYEAEILKMR